MKFNTVAEAYNFYKGSNVAVIEARAAAIKADIAGNADADVTAYNIELEGMEQAKTEAEQRGGKPAPAAIPEAATTAGEGASEKVYRSAFYKKLMNKPLDAAEQAAYDAVNGEKRSNVFSTLSNTAAVIPTTTLNEIVTKARDLGGIFSISRGFHMPANISVPVATPGGAASWHTEGQAIETEKPSVTPVTFAANEIMRIISISAAVETMSVDAFESYLAEELTASVMQTIATAMVNGTGSGQGTGIIAGITWNNDNSVTVAKTGTLSYANIVAAISKLKRGYSNNAKFVMNNSTLYGDVYSIVDNNGKPIFVADPTEKTKGRILGFEVVVDDFMADHDILFGDFRYNGYNMPAGIALDVSRESSFAKGLIDYRALAIADCKPIVDEAFVRITKATA